MSTSAPPSRSSAREWLARLRLSGFTMIMLALVVLGALVLVPTVSTYVEQRQKIAALEESVQLTQSEIDALEDEQQRWGDEAYIMAQARERLYYTKPGEVPYLIVNDLDESEQPQDAEPISDEVEEARSDWGGQLLRSITEAGLSERAAAE
ncbi:MULTISPECIES: septum formation initiator family protein [unclassified Microbacterium]|uniref:septum formation initiator family protein n=1 Tax=unclassified Microbacterium TaxID=2609290 RepID=UPI000B34C95D|nr:septum formation initiator family protein [Microbacterium sp. JB110]RCS61859.1 septum formation initiator family protein [Microbacterium sp. JB110]